MSTGADTATKLANSVAFTLIARIAMVLAMPVIGWMVQRGVTTVDEVGRKVDVLHVQSLETNSDVKLIKQAQAQQTAIISDHEARVRALESLQRRAPP